MTNFPTATPPSPDHTQVAIAHNALTDEQGWFKSLTIHSVWVDFEIWYSFHGTIIRFKKPTRAEFDASTPIKVDVWPAEAGASGERNTERIFEAERWAWEDHVEFVRGL